MKKVLFLVMFLPLVAVSQKLENLKAVPEGNKIIITYDLTADNSRDRFDVSLYASHNNFSSPIKFATGDIGDGISEGKNKRIEWDAKSELGEFKGQLSFEVRAEVIAAFAIQNKITSAKRGKSTSITWRGGNKNQDVKIELLKAGSQEGTVATVSNNGTYQWFIDPAKKPGSDYQLRLSNGKDVITTEPFAIKHKIPTALKVAPLVLLGILALPSSSSTPGSTARTLPAPPSLTLD